MGNGAFREKMDRCMLVLVYICLAAAQSFGLEIRYMLDEDPAGFENLQEGFGPSFPAAQCDGCTNSTFTPG